MKIGDKILFVIDEIEFKHFEFNSLVTNFWLIKEFLCRGFLVSITTKNRLFTDGKNAMSMNFESYVENNDIKYRGSEKKQLINDFDVVFFRPDPPVNIDYINACYIFDFVDNEKTFIINNPVEIKKFNEKFHLNCFSQYVPENIVTSSKELIKNFVNEHNEAVIKPLNRCFGSGVYHLGKNDKNLNSIISTATDGEKTLVMVQKYLDKAIFGDKRILIAGEHVFEQCVMKLPSPDDFKFNAHKDEFFAPAELSENEKHMALDIAKVLSKKGLFMVGLDVIDEKIIEINVTSPCYFIKEINSLYNIEFQDILMDKLLELIQNRNRHLSFSG